MAGRWETVLLAVLAAGLAACGKPADRSPGPEGRPATAAGRTHAAAMPAAYHEFQLFGKARTYLSHYPMFASIHAYQVVVEARLHGGEGAIAAFRTARPDITLTVSPSKKTDAALPERDDWVLPLEVRPGGRFNADVHWVAEGDDFADPKARHFVARNVDVEVLRVIRQQMFYPDTPKAPELTYLTVGRPGDLHLVHLLDRHPDFDQVLSIEAGAPLAEGAVVRIPGRPNTPDGRLKAGEAATAATADGRVVTIRAIAETGFEELEIQH